MTGKKTISLLLGAVLAAGSIAGILWMPHTEQRTAHYAAAETEESWFIESETEEDFDFGLDEYWVDLDNLEYTVKDRLKCYLFIGTDHSGNEKATDETYKGSMADFLLLVIINKTENTYGFIQLNRDSLAFQNEPWK